MQWSEYYGTGEAANIVNQTLCEQSMGNQDGLKVSLLREVEERRQSLWGGDGHRCHLVTVHDLQRL